MATINYNTAAALTNARGSRVYTRAAWGDAWTLQPTLVAVQCVWNAAPDRSTATLVREYGRTLQPGAIALADLTPVAIEGHFVLIEWDADEVVESVPVINYWLGILEASADAPDGPTDGSIPASGVQTFTAYGMERMLQLATIIDTVYKLGVNPETAISARSGGPTAFNANGVPNRSAEVITDETFVFESDLSVAEFWSTRDIVKHLLFYHLPTADGQVGSIPWELANESIVPDWDSPTIEVDGLSVWDVLTRLLDSRLLLGFGVGFDNTSLKVAPHSLAASSVTLDDKTFAANATQHTFTFSADPLTRGEITVDRTDMVDQVIVRGAKRISVCTIPYVDEDLPEGSTEFVNGWSGSQATAYNTAASGDPDYSTWDVVEQRQANDTARRSTTLEDVWSLLKIELNNCQVPNGETLVNIFPPLTGTDPHKPYRASVRLLPTLPLRKGVDYAGDVAEVDELVAGSFRDPLVVFPLQASTTQFADALHIGQRIKSTEFTGEVIDYTISVNAEADRLALRLIVHGAPQHIIGGSGFTALDADEVKEKHWSLAGVNVDGAYSGVSVATVALTDDRYCEYAQPASVSSADVVRKRVFYVGEAYQQVYIAPGTVVGVSGLGSKETSNGGYLRDDTQKLEYLAKLLAAYHTNPRVSVALTSYRRTSLASVGDMILTANGVTVGAVIKQIQIDAPLSDGRTPPRATQSIVASASDVDLLATLAIAAGEQQ